MKKIENILVAVDFSVTARRAYVYANALAKTLDATLTIIHVKESVSMLSNAVSSTHLSGDDKRLIKDIEELISEENSAIEQKTIKGAIKIKVLTGNAASVVIQLSENKDVDLIVIGTTGFSDVFTKIFGSVSLDVSNKAHCPVLLVPREARWHPIDKILFASNYDSMTPHFVSKINDFALSLNAKIHFVNVRNYDPILEPKQKDINWNDLVAPLNSARIIRHATIYGNDTVEELKQFSEDNTFSLIAFASRHRNFWQNLAHKSTTKNMAISTTLPLLIMHVDDEEI